MGLMIYHLLVSEAIFIQHSGKTCKPKPADLLDVKRINWSKRLIQHYK